MTSNALRYFEPFLNLDSIMNMFGFPGTMLDDGTMDYSQSIPGASVDPSKGFQTLPQHLMDMMTPEFYNQYLTYKREVAVANILENIKVYDNSRKNLNHAKSNSYLNEVLAGFHGEMLDANREVGQAQANAFELAMGVVDQNKRKGAYYDRMYGQSAT